MLKIKTNNLYKYKKVAKLIFLSMIALNLLSSTIISSALTPIKTQTEQNQKTGIIQSPILCTYGSNEPIQPEIDLQEKQLQEPTFLYQSNAGDTLNSHAIICNNQLNLFEGDNLDWALLRVIESIMQVTESDAYKYSHFRDILNNPRIMDILNNIKNCLSSKDSDLQIKQINIISYLVAVEAVMATPQLSDNQFRGFITSAKRAYETLVSRELANQIIEENRIEIEKKMGNENTAAEVTLSFNVNSGTLEPKLNFGLNASEGGSEKSFYRITKSGNFSGSVAFGLPKNVDISVNGKLELAQVLVCRSLEQFLDSNSRYSSTIYKRAPQINDIAKARKQMQEHEKAVLASFRTSMEFYLKFLEIISQDVQLVAPKVTKVSTSNKEFTIQATAGLSADLKALAKAGITAKASATGGYTTTQVYHNYLSLISEDCFPSLSGGSSEDIITKLNTAKFPIIREFKSYILEKNNDQTVATLASNVKGDLVAYNHCLAIISNEHATKNEKSDARRFKHKMEKKWLPQNVTGRLNMLKAAVSVAPLLRSAYNLKENKEMQKLFKELHFQITELEKVQILTRSIMPAKQSAEFSTKHKSKSYGIEGSFDFEVPVIGKSTAKILYEVINSKLEGENNKNLIFIIKMPVHNNNVIGQKAFQKTLAAIQKKLVDSTNETAQSINKGIKLLDEKFSPVLKQLNYKTKEPLYKKIAEKIPKKYAQLTIEFAQIPLSNALCTPLPGEDTLCKRPQTWVLKRVTATEIKTLKAEDLSVGLASANISGEVRKNSTVIGDDSFAFIINKFNNFAQSLQDRTSQESINELWTSFKEEQKDQLKRLFENIANTESNAHYELQCMYNGIKLNSILRKNNYQPTGHIDEVFSNFLRSCKLFSEDNSDWNYRNTSKLLDNVLKLNQHSNYTKQ